MSDGTAALESVGVGERLRNAREAKGLSLQAVEGVTHIRAIYLQALEDEQFDRLPGRAYAKGFLRTYAAALGLDPDRLLEAYPQVLETPAQSIVGVHPMEVPIQPAARRSPLRRAVTYTSLVLTAGIVIVGTIGFLQWRQFNAPVTPRTATPPAAVPPSQAEPVQPQPAVPEPPPAAESERQPPTVTPPASGVNVEVRASGTSWMRVIADGKQVFQGLVQDGDTNTWHGERTVTMRVGNSAAVQVLVNGKPFRAKAGQRVWEETFEAP